MKHPPYHLRMNKAVDRFLLISLLRKLSKLSPLYMSEKINYCSLAGPFLEDLRLMYEFFPEMELVSVETDGNTYQRQLFHRFTSRLTIHQMSLADYLSRVQPSGTEIFWLDYIDFNASCLNEFGQVLERVTEGSVVKITVPCDLKNTEFKDNSPNDEDELTDKQKQFLERFRVEFPDSSVDYTDFSHPNKYSELAQSIIKVQAKRSLSAVKGPLRFQLLSSSTYNDGTQMLSVAGVIVEKSKVDDIKTHFQNWPFNNLDWHSPKQIKVPTLSIKEKMKLEEHVPLADSTSLKLSDKLGYLIEDDPIDSEKSLRQYAEFSQYYPVFVKVVS